MSIKILIVDDHEVLREGLRSLLMRARPEWNVCGEASNGQQAIQLTQKLRPQLIILDISMPNMSGLEVCEHLRKLGIETPILIFTTHESERLKVEVRDAGAQGYVMKAQAARDLIRAIDALLKGGTFFGSPSGDEPAHNDAQPDKPKSGPWFRILCPVPL